MNTKNELIFKNKPLDLGSTPCDAARWILIIGNDDTYT